MPRRAGTDHAFGQRLPALHQRRLRRNDEEQRPDTSIAEFHTAGAPPSRGITIRAIIGWTRKSRNEPRRMVRRSALAAMLLVSLPQ